MQFVNGNNAGQFYAGVGDPVTHQKAIMVEQSRDYKIANDLCQLTNEII